jgi:hypothetical protein
LESSIPTGEEAAGGRRVDARSARQRASHLRQMAPRVQKAVRERIPHFARRPQDVHVVAIGEHPTAKTEDTIHGSCESCGDGLHAAREIPLTRRFYDRVQVIVLD